MKYLTKSDYLKFRVHPAYLWYSKHQPERLPKPDANQHYVYEQGNQFEQLAMTLINQPTVIDGDPSDSQQLAKTTKQAIDQGAETIVQGAFITNDNLYCRPDLLEKIGDNQWRLSEIKSSTSFKRRHRYDLAFQRHVLQSLGFNVSRVQLLHVNSDYVRSGEIVPERLVASRDVTEEVESLKSEVTREIEAAKDTIDLTEIDDHPALANNLSSWMEVYRHLHPKLPADSVLNLTQLKSQLVRRLRQDQIKSITELSTDQLTAKQTAQVTAWKKDQLLINQENIADFLRTLEYPLYFLDYETSAHVIPLFEGTKPYQQMPFQYSLHKLASPAAELEHFEYLHTDESLPVEPLVDKLLDEIGQQGTILAWFHKFEMYCNRAMADIAPQYRAELMAVNQRMVDLRVPFARLDYVDKRFQGSTSLKNVLPVMCPELSYKELGIQEGGAAQRLWQQVVIDKDDDIDRQQVFDDLLAYCKLDTLAMVEIYRKLSQVAELDEQPVQATLL